MAHKTLMDGTVYDVDGARLLIKGSTYNIESGKTIVDGTVRNLQFNLSYPVYINGLGDIDDADEVYVRIKGVDYYGNELEEIIVPDGTPIECILRNVPYYGDEPYASGSANGEISLNKNAVATTTTPFETISYTHIVDSPTYVFVGTLNRSSGNYNKVDIADDRNMLFSFGAYAYIATDGMTWEEYCASEQHIPIISCVDGKVEATMGVAWWLCYPDETIVNSNDKILPLRYGILSKG